MKELRQLTTKTCMCAIAELLSHCTLLSTEETSPVASLHSLTCFSLSVTRCSLSVAPPHSVISLFSSRCDHVPSETRMLKLDRCVCAKVRVPIDSLECCCRQLLPCAVGSYFSSFLSSTLFTAVQLTLKKNSESCYCRF